MQTIELNKDLFRGAVSIETNDTGLRPWRLPHDQLSLFASELAEKAGETAGVRVAFVSDSTSVELHQDSHCRRRNLFIYKLTGQHEEDGNLFSTKSCRHCESTKSR